MKRTKLQIEEWATQFRSVANVSIRVLVMAFAVTMLAGSCGKDGDGDGGDGGGGDGDGKVQGGIMPTAKGYVTVNGMSAWNGKYVSVSGKVDNGDMFLIGVRDITVSSSSMSYYPVKIANGSAKVPLYYADANEDFKAYDGSHSDGDITVMVIAEAKYANIAAATLEKGCDFKTVKFTGGSVTLNWADGDEF
jgi:hypothetical protein